MVLCFAAHEVTNFLELYLDGRKVYWAGSGSGYTVRNGIGFGGGADGNDHIDPSGNTYNFANASSGHRGVWVEARFGDQGTGDYLGSLHANESRWGPDANGNTPTLQGHSYLYLKCEYNTDDFPQKPDARATIAGKSVYDPRTGTTAYSDNWALVVADILTNDDFGLGMAVNQDQLIAAANICDEPVAFSGAGGGTEARFTANYTWTLDKSIGDVLNDLMTGAGGRLSYIDGEWHIFVAAFVGATASFSSANLLAKPQWSAQRKFRDKFNYCQGTYIAPVYPYAVAGNYYGSADAGTSTQDNFSYGYQPTSFPTYACDVQHGYASDQYLTEDGGVELGLTLDFASVLSITQAQRLAKIAILRNRQQGSGTLVMGPEALILQPNDTFYFSYPQRGWSDKLLEVSKVDIGVVPNEQGVPQIQVALTVNETDPSVYAWNSTDELTPYDAPAAPTNPGQFSTAPPTNVHLTSSAATALVQPDGTVSARIEVTWDTPADVRVTSIEVQYQLSGASTWSDGGTVSVASNVAYIPVVAGQQYDVQIRSVRSSGGTSVWVTESGFTASLVLSVQGQEGLGIGSLIGEAFTDGTAAIICQPFTATIGNQTLTITPTPSVDAGLSQGTRYWLYWIDSTFTATSVTAIPTTNPADYRGKLGYFEIDSIVTPSTPTSGGSSSGGVRIYPSVFHDIGTRTSFAPESAYDGDTSSSTTIAGFSRAAPEVSGDPDFSIQTTQGECVYQGFPSTATTSSATLTVIASSTVSGGGSASINVDYGTGSSTIFSTASTIANGTYTMTIPSGTLFSNVTLDCTATPSEPTTPATTHSATLVIAEIYIDT